MNICTGSYTYRWRIWKSMASNQKASAARLSLLLRVTEAVYSIERAIEVLAHKRYGS